MKKVLFLAACGALLGLVSCKKDRDCECTSGSTATTRTYTKISKHRAKVLCASYSTSYNGTTTKVDCKIK